MERQTKVQVLSSVNHILIVSISFPDPLPHINQPNDAATIPCEVCEELVEWRYFEDHLSKLNNKFSLVLFFIQQKACGEQEQRPRQTQPRLIH